MGFPRASRRRPRPCGLTIHPSLGCNVGCAYCYLWEMSLIVPSPEMNPLSPKSLVRELRRNPYFVESRMGTFLALGSLGEPFLTPSITERTLEYLDALKTLGNPLQVSTKFTLPMDARLAGVNVLITVVAWDSYKSLEPAAPPPCDRLDSAAEAAEFGALPTLFVRPIIPGVTLNELPDILDHARESGVKSVVFGSLRVSLQILKRLRKAGVDISEIEQRMKRPLRAGKQVYISSADLKVRAMEEARRRGLIPLGSACCASALAHGVPCFDVRWLHRMCTGCPNDCRSKMPSKAEVAALLTEWGLEGSVGDDRVELTPGSWSRLRGPERHRLEVLTRRIVVMGGGPGGT